MKRPKGIRRKINRDVLSIEENNPQHKYTEIKRIPGRYTVEVISQCGLCGCERFQTKVNTKVIRVHYSRSGMTHQTSPECWGAKNPA